MKKYVNPIVMVLIGVLICVLVGNGSADGCQKEECKD